MSATRLSLLPNHHPQAQSKVTIKGAQATATAKKEIAFAEVGRERTVGSG